MPGLCRVSQPLSRAPGCPHFCPSKAEVWVHAGQFPAVLGTLLPGTLPLQAPLSSCPWATPPSIWTCLHTPHAKKKALSGPVSLCHHAFCLLPLQENHLRLDHTLSSSSILSSLPPKLWWHFLSPFPPLPGLKQPFLKSLWPSRQSTRSGRSLAMSLGLPPHNTLVQPPVTLLLSILSPPHWLFLYQLLCWEFSPWLLYPHCPFYSSPGLMVSTTILWHWVLKGPGLGQGRWGTSLKLKM